MQSFTNSAQRFPISGSCCYKLKCFSNACFYGSIPFLSFYGQLTKASVSLTQGVGGIGADSSRGEF